MYFHDAMIHDAARHFPYFGVITLVNLFQVVAGSRWQQRTTSDLGVACV